MHLKTTELLLTRVLKAQILKTSLTEMCVNSSRSWGQEEWSRGKVALVQYLRLETNRNYLLDRWERPSGLWSQSHSLGRNVVCLGLVEGNKWNIVTWVKPELSSWNRTTINIYSLWTLQEESKVGHSRFKLLIFPSEPVGEWNWLKASRTICLEN